MTARRLLVVVAVGHGALALLCAAALLADAVPILGVHPALKPLKFASSIAVFLGSLAILLPRLTAQERAKTVVAGVLSATMVLEMTAIVVQALRGTTSHFNGAGALDEALWHVMVGAIVVATGVMTWVAWRTITRPLIDTPPLQALGWRAGAAIFLLAAVSGFMMGARLMHSVGGVDGGPGLPLVNWSTEHGDLRVSHFFSLHALQVLPLAGRVLERRPAIVVALNVMAAVVAVLALAGALLGLPLLGSLS